jgi:hypothetical protein
MKIPVTMIAILALVGCASPQSGVFAPGQANPGSPVGRPTAPQSAQACAASRPHHGFNYADADRPAPSPAAFVTTARTEIGAWPIVVANADTSPRCAGSGKRKAMYASGAGTAFQPNSG